MEPTNHKGTKHQVERVLDKISSIVSLSLISIALGALVVWESGDGRPGESALRNGESDAGGRMPGT